MIRLNPAAPRGIAWLASYPRSGNTWLRTCLYQIDRICRGSPREDDELSKIERVSTTEIKFQKTYELILGKPLAQASLLETLKARAPVHAASAEGSPEIVMLKTHYVFGVLNGSPTINQDVSVGAVYLIRDPRDVAVSLANHLGKSIDETVELLNATNLRTVGQQETVEEIWGSWSHNVESWTAGADDSLLVVRYEDLLQAPAQTLGQIIHHLRKTATPEQIAEAAALCSFDKLQQQEERFSFVDRPKLAGRFFREGRAGRWRDKLTAAQVNTIVKAHGTTMARFGYLDR